MIHGHRDKGVGGGGGVICLGLLSIMIVIVKKVQLKADEEHLISISAKAFLTNLFFSKFKTISESIVILSSYTVRKNFRMGFHDSWP